MFFLKKKKKAFYIAHAAFYMLKMNIFVLIYDNVNFQRLGDWLYNVFFCL